MGDLTVVSGLDLVAPSPRESGKRLQPFIHGTFVYPVDEGLRFNRKVFHLFLVLSFFVPCPVTR